MCQECGAQSPKWLGRCPSAARGTRSSRSARRQTTSRKRPPRIGTRAQARPPARSCMPTSSSTPACAAVDVDRRVRSRARRRRRAGVARPARRRARHRQVDAAAAGGGEHGAHGRPGALQLRRRIGASDQVARRAPGGRRGAAVPAGRNVPRAHPRGNRAHQAGARDRRLGADGLLAEVSVGARQHQPGARGGHAAAVHRQGTERADVSRRPRHEGRQPRRARRRSSTSSTRCCISRASAITRIGSCAP